MNAIDTPGTLASPYLLHFLGKLSHPNRFLVCCSGGLDSSVLLHLFYQLKPMLTVPIQVIYVDHGLHQDSRIWQSHCESLCADYELSYLPFAVHTRPDKGESLEAWAREQRYDLIRKHMQQHDVIFTAHHLDDQVETFFLQAIRGAGPRGLSAMPGIKEFGPGIMARPLLNVKRSTLQHYAYKHALKWVDDPANTDVRHDRNYLRKEIMPAILQRWPGSLKSLERVTKQQHEASELLHEMAHQDFQSVYSARNDALCISGMQHFSDARIKNLIVYWFRKKALPLPAACHFQTILSDVFLSHRERSPCVNWQDVECRRYGDYLYILRAETNSNIPSVMEWGVHSPLRFASGEVSLIKSSGPGFNSASMNNARVTIRFRQGGETIRPYPSGLTKTVKKLFREQRILPWYREKIPMIYINDRLAVIPGICIDSDFYTGNNASRIVWSDEHTCRQYDE